MRVHFGQGNLVEAFVRKRKSKDGWLYEIDRLVDWPRLKSLFSDVCASRSGGASYPILIYVKLLLLQQWHGLSDPALEGLQTIGCRFAGSAAFRSIGRYRITPRFGGFVRRSPEKVPTGHNSLLKR